MAQARSRLAKLTRPRLHAPLPRARLFRRLDGLRARPLVWIAGPPGSGKTTLAASYLDAARLRSIWYQIDPADSDPATFFLYLRQAVEDAHRSRAKPLPLFTPEYRNDLPGFARRFFREAFQRLPAQTLVVLDNYHELAPESPLHEAVAAALADIPPEANLLVLSRTEPPPEYAAALLAEQLAVLGWAELKLTPEEGRQVAEARGLGDAGLARRLHAQTDGWFAGLALLLERVLGGDQARGVVRSDAQEVVFDYFAQVIFDRAPEPMQAALLRTALLPHASAALLGAIAGLETAPRHLEALYRRHMFVERTQDSVPVYRFHALFRAFLRHRAAVALPPGEQARIARAAADGFEARGEPEAAFALWVQVEDWAAAARTLSSAAPSLLSQGRWRTVLAWCEDLPETVADGDARVMFCRGRALTHEDRVGARALLERAYRLFEGAGDRAGQIRCAAAVLDAIFLRYRDFRDMDEWIGRLGHLLQQVPDDFAPEDDLRIHAALLVAATFRDPENSLLAFARQRVEHLLVRATDANLVLTVASALHVYENTTLDVAVGELASRIARPLVDLPEVTAHTLGFYLAMAGYTEYIHGRYESALQHFDRAEAAIRDQGLDELALGIEQRRALAQRRSGLQSAAAATFGRIKSATAIVESAFAPIGFIEACIAFDRGMCQDAARLLADARTTIEENGHFIGRMLLGLMSTNILVGCGQLAEASNFLEKVRALVTGPVTEHYLAAIDLNAAWAAHRGGVADERDRLLADALARAHDPKARERLRWYPNALAELLPIAIRNGTDAGLARELVREFSVPPPPGASEAWPWRIRIHAMGRFEVLVDDEPLVFGRKTPKRTLALLAALVAFGGREVAEDRIVDALWPGEDADAAHRALGAALHRLRAILRVPEAVRQSGSALSLDPGLCFADALWLDAADRGLDGDAGLVGLYHGEFLANEANAPWALPLRERLRGRFVRAVESVGSRLETGSEYAAASALYERGIAADPLIEGFYRGLIRCHLAAGRRADAGSVYRRLQRTLAAALGAEPSAETHALLHGAADGAA